MNWKERSKNCHFFQNRYDFIYENFRRIHRKLVSKLVRLLDKINIQKTIYIF